ncbi:hypothetical protein PG5_32240 [Pseudomonas sp. G5(2012)]|nr:hypothetical protein PG5_32240 [Pseudomonas sp. G5(2012)]
MKLLEAARIGHAFVLLSFIRPQFYRANLFQIKKDRSLRQLLQDQELPKAAIMRT